MMTVARPVDWKVCAHSTPGSMHLRRGLPNQDAVRWERPENDDLQSLPVFLSLADGHGSRRSYRSDQGAQMGTGAGLETMRDLLADVTEDNWKQRAESATRTLPAALVRRWQERVKRHLQENPLGKEAVEVDGTQEGEEVPAGADENEPWLVYGSTCFCAAVLPGGLFLGQLGDGDILAVDASGEVYRPLPPDARHFANETTSLCSPGAAANMRCRVLSLSQRQAPELLVLATDGYANSFASEDDFLSVATDLRQMIREEGFEAVSDQLESWLREASEEGSGDDITVGLLYRQPNESEDSNPSDEPKAKKGEKA